MSIEDSSESRGHAGLLLDHGLHVGAKHRDHLLAESFVLAGRDAGLKDAAADADHGRLQCEGREAGVDGERLGRGTERFLEGTFAAEADVFGQAETVDV